MPRRPRLSLKLSLVAVLPLVLGACGSMSARTVRPPSAVRGVRPPTPVERAGITRAVEETWTYESAPLYVYSALRRRHHRARVRPRIVRIVVNRADPRFSSAVVELRDARGQRRGPAVVMVFERGRDWFTDKPGANAVGGPAITFSNACTPSTPSGIRALLCPNPWSVLGYPRPRIRAQSAYSQRISSPDLHAIDWRNVALPGAVCGSSRPIRPHNYGYGPEAFIHADVDLLWWNPVWVYSWGKPVFGDLDGDGRDEAALGVVCANGGGTADGQLAFSDVIFKTVRRSLEVVGIVTPQQPLDPETPHVPLSRVVAIKRGKVIVSEAWYGQYDGTCCASGEARTVWTYHHGARSPTPTMILQKPWNSPLTVEELLAEPGGRELQGQFDGQEKTNIVATPRLHFVLELASFGPVKRNVKVTLTIRQSSTIVRTKTIDRVPPLASGRDATVVFGNLGPLKLGTKSTVTLDIRDKGAFPLRYPVTFTRG